MNSHQLINQTNGGVEYYTPLNIIEAARRTLGCIYLDPASSFAANLRVKAESYYTEEQDGLSMDWYKTIWLNHPFGRVQNPKWISKLELEFKSGRVDGACCITFACTSEKWFQPLLWRPQCFLSPRTNYLLPDGSTLRGVTKGSVVTYYGSDFSRFAQEFQSLGVVKTPHII